mmetsp:Transcript_33275/g.70016  ORF Transcript_33275/g.70016 Transcript_33275/m.70016 type:complete len:350 (+) Transcript_33275:257-1306(+)
MAPSTLREPLLSPPQRSWRPLALRIGGALLALLLLVGAFGGWLVFSSRSAEPDAQGSSDKTDSRQSSQMQNDSKGPRLQIINGCKKDDLWIAGFSVAAPIFDKDVKLTAGESMTVPIPDEGLPSTRFWAKWSCDGEGQNCVIGQSGGPGEGCGPTGCAPPVDSKFEATFGCLTDVDKCAKNPSAPTEPIGPTDWWDVSQVDGWTLPYKVELVGECDAPSTIDCSSLALSQCPERDNLGGKYSSETLRVHSPDDKSISVGCYSPCGKLTYSQWGQGYDHTPESEEAQDYCCPTPPISPKQCSAGPVEKTAYVRAVHKLCPSVYAYAYDDGVGLSQCPAGTGYKVTFYCPM